MKNSEDLSPQIEEEQKDEKLQAVHIRKNVHKKFKSFCIDNDIRVGDTAERALLQFIELSTGK